MQNDFINNIFFPENEEGDVCDFFDELKKQNLPLFLYGAGNLALCIIQRLKKKNIQVDGLLIDGEESDYLTIEKRKMGILVFSFSSFVMTRTEPCNVIIAFAKGYRKREVLEKFHFFINVYVLDNPFEHHKKIESEYVKGHINKLEETYELLEDDLSKKSLCAFINARINHDIKWILDVSKEDIDEFNNDVMYTKPDETLLDIGAYDGGSIRRFLASNNYHVKKIIGIEPDENNFCKLSAYINSLQKYECELHRIGCWFEKTKLPFNHDNKCSRLDSDSQYFINVDTIDNICGKESVSLYNMGISVAEYEILQGSENMIKKCHPRLVIFMGSAKDELWSIPQYIRELSPKYKIYLRFLTAMPSRFFLYAV